LKAEDRIIMQTKELLSKLAEINKTRSYDKIGKDLGVSSQTVYRWIKGKNSPSGLALEKVAQYLSEFN